MESPPQQPQKTVTILPIVPQNDGTYVYLVVKGSLYANDSAVFGLDGDDYTAITNRFKGSTVIVNGINVKAPPVTVINSLSQLGYKVLCSCGESEIAWTLQREI